MPPISDFRSDSPLNFASVGWLYLGSFDDLNFGPVLPVVTIERLCWHSDVFEFHGAPSIQSLSSHTRSCFQPHSSRQFSASSDLRRAGATVVLELSREPVVNLNKVAQFVVEVCSHSEHGVRMKSQANNR